MLEERNSRIDRNGIECNILEAKPFAKYTQVCIETLVKLQGHSVPCCSMVGHQISKKKNE